MIELNLLFFYNWMQGKVREDAPPDGYEHPCLTWRMSVDGWGAPKGCHRPLAEQFGYKGRSVLVRRMAWLCDDVQRQRKALKHTEYILPGCGNPLCVEPSHMVLRTVTQQVTGRKRTMQTRIKMSLIAGDRRSAIPNDRVPDIINDPRPNTHIAKDWNVSDTCIADIKSGRHRIGAWVAANPFAQLVAA